MKVLILEDSEVRANWFRREFVGHAINIAATVSEFVDHIARDGPVDAVLLDHDLGGEGTENAAGADGQSGGDAVRWLLANTGSWRFAAVHSLNAVESFRMADRLREAVGYRRAARWSFLDMRCHGVAKDLERVIEGLKAEGIA